MNNNSSKSYRTAFMFLTLLFFLWGFLTVIVDSLIPRLKEVFELSYFQAGMVQFAFFGAYFLLSIPASFILSKIGYKKGIILGILMMAAGCLLFYPASSLRLFWVFMLGYFILAGGITILQVAANPYVTILGPEKSAASRLNLSQAFNSLGTSIAPIVGALFILSDKIMTSQQIDGLSEAEKTKYYAAEASAVQLPFLTIAGILIAIALVFVFVNLPKVIGEGENKGSYSAAFKNKNLILGAIGLFCYVGAEVAIGSYMVNYFMKLELADVVRNTPFMKSIANWFLTDDLNAVDGKAVVGIFVTFYWTGAMVGRFIGAYLTSIIKPAKVLSIFAVLALALIIISIQSEGLTAMWAIIAVGLFNSIMFPTIFSLGLDELGESKPQGSGIMCTMIVGGAIVPPLFGLLTDTSGFGFAFMLVMCCYLYIFFFAYRHKKTEVSI
ncbi:MULTISPECIES: sugar MFS transporter [Mesonia]|uniref:L-fucose-proton symporter n=1 Tax=Mesonia oceanica TaxID=2687242 RepID=A0AC61YA49_9FLAO|nr:MULTISPECIES: sugar MFS transporter [Mesonia]MAN26713.1 glucose/galactose MFS transporter [Mesonia sp.]MAQ39831.1 glucose/galactose MFS transporter [Mesonia sp.]MBJ96689.1 glucose/galactose MFS transporter [Flavobacteriaceae bacterium]VVV01387.1 L-fucose-proton symporter [Mesonia oceanica]|tara:strand:- start:9657 stop:10976 length:1320 start_codon:yes stop_codon:yes gene_type:complete